MGIISEEIDEKESLLIEEKAKDIQNGRYRLNYYDLYWSLDLAGNTITLNLLTVYSSESTIKVLSRQESEAEFSGAGLSVKISANFESKQLIINGYAVFRTHHGSKRKRYENVIITSW